MKNTLKYILLLTLFTTAIKSEIRAQIITTVAGGVTGHGGYWGDGGLATNAAIGYFGGVAVDKNGNVYIADANNHRLRKVDKATGIITTIAGTGIAGYNGDGIPAITAQLDNPGFVTLDTSGNLYITEANFRIRKIDVLTGIITTFAGTGIRGSTGDGGLATDATLQPSNFKWDNFGNAYLICGGRIRKINPAGIISTVAGTGFSGITGEGVPATSTNLSKPRGLAVDVLGNVYFGDSTHAIRKVTMSTGLITRVAGTGDNVGIPYSGDGIIATTCNLVSYGLEVDDSGNIYNSDFGNSRIEKIDTFGIIRTIAGTGVSGFSGDGGLALLAKISLPENVTIDKCGNVYIADFNNRRVRKITYDTSYHLPLESLAVSGRAAPQDGITIYPNPATNLLHITGLPSAATYRLLSMVGAVARCGELPAGGGAAPLHGLPPGMYVLELVTERGERVVRRVVKE